MFTYVGSQSRSGVGVLELELQMLIAARVGAGTQTRSSESSELSSMVCHLSSPIPVHLNLLLGLPNLFYIRRCWSGSDSAHHCLRIFSKPFPGTVFLSQKNGISVPLGVCPVALGFAETHTR